MLSDKMRYILIVFLFLFIFSTQSFIVNSGNSNSNETSSDTNNNSTIVCETYVAITTPNTSLICGTEDNPCTNLLDAISYCNSSTFNIKIYIDDGDYMDLNNTGLSVFNQSITITSLSSSSKVNFNFTQSNIPFIQLLEPPLPSTSILENNQQQQSSSSTNQENLISNTLSTNITINGINIFGLNLVNNNGSVISFINKYTNGWITITNSTFKEITGYCGSVVYINSNNNPDQGVELTISNSSFTNNSAFIGSSVYAVNNVLTIVSQSTFTNCDAKYGTVLYSRSSYGTSFSNSTFNNNSAFEFGLIYLENQNLIQYQNFSTLVFQGNDGTTNKTSNIYLSNSTITLENSYFNQNSLTALWIQNSINSGGKNNQPMGTTVVNGCFFSNNNITKGSAAALRSDIGAKLTVVNSQFFNNSAFNAGSILITNSETFSISNSVFFNNSADNNGGVFYSNNTASILISNLTLVDNYAVNSGATIYCVNSTIEFLKSSIFSLNVDRFDSGFGIGCGSGQVCKFTGTLSSLDTYCSSYFPKKTNSLTKGQEAGIIIGVIGAVILISIAIILLIKKFSKYKLRRNYKVIN